jgi:tetratricopeptide (TPR) repeat protein
MFQAAGVALLAGGLCGCLPSASDPREEQNESHFKAGKSRVNSLDFHGAIESFERALEMNPRSASAHFELGWLFNEKEPDPAAAIYHYEKYLKLRPNADNAELVRQRINACKQDLAKAVMPLPVTPNLQLQFEQLADENKRLKEELAKWQAYATGQPRGAANSNSPVLILTRPGSISGGAGVGTPGAVLTPERGATGGSIAPPSAPRTRTHTVKAGDSPYAIAKQYGVKLDALMAANPKLDPKRLKPGQVLNIPAP